MSERLSDLQRQRALAQEQLAWLDREIARELGTASPPVATPVPLKPRPVPLASSASRPAMPVDADDLIKKFREEGRTVHSEVKRGCLIYFFAAFALLGLGLLGFYLIWRK